MFAMLKAPNGKRMLANEDLVLAYVEGDAGQAIAIYVSGPIETGHSFQDLLDAKMAELDSLDDA